MACENDPEGFEAQKDEAQTPHNEEARNQDAELEARDERTRRHRGAFGAQKDETPTPYDKEARKLAVILQKPFERYPRDGLKGLTESELFCPAILASELKKRKERLAFDRGNEFYGHLKAVTKEEERFKEQERVAYDVLKALLPTLKVDSSKYRINHDASEARVAKKPRTGINVFKANSGSDGSEKEYAWIVEVFDAVDGLRTDVQSLKEEVHKLGANFRSKSSIGTLPEEHDGVLLPLESEHLIEDEYECGIANILVGMKGDESPIFNKLLWVLPPVGKTVDGAALPQYPQVGREMRGIMARSGKRRRPYQKQLSRTDIDGSLTIPIEFANHSVFPLLNRDEKEELKNGKSLEVTGFDGDGNYCTMRLKYNPKESKVVLHGDLAFLKDSKGDDLKEHVHWLNSWPFRHPGTERLCFVFTVSEYPTTKRVTKKSEKGKEVMGCQEI